MTAPDASASGGNVRVVSRIRPLSKTEIEQKSEEAISSLSTLERSLSDLYKVSEDPEVLQVHGADGQKRWFELDAVFDKNSSQEEVYVRSGAKNAVTNDIFKGFNCTVLAYGQVRNQGVSGRFFKNLSQEPYLTLVYVFAFDCFLFNIFSTNII